MKHTSHSEPVSVHLERHRDCLERHRKDRGESDIFAYDRAASDPRDGRPALPFERIDDED